MEWWGILLTIALGVGGARGIIAFVEYGGRSRKPKRKEPVIYQEPFTFLETRDKIKAHKIDHEAWLVEYHLALSPKDRLIADGYVPGTISSSEARLLERLYKTDKLQFALLVKKLNTRAYSEPDSRFPPLKSLDLADNYFDMEDW